MWLWRKLFSIRPNGKTNCRKLKEPSCALIEALSFGGCWTKPKLMLKYKIITAANSLREICKETTIDEGFEVIDKLEATLADQAGIGLAANQIGIKKRVCILRVPQENNGEKITFGINFINPVITKFEGPIIFRNEGCLSFPGLNAETLRYSHIEVTDLLEPSGRKFNGLVAICAQHEIDHLNGKTMYDSLYLKLTSDKTCPCQSKKLFKDCCQPNVVDIGRKNG